MPRALAVRTWFEYQLSTRIKGKKIRKDPLETYLFDGKADDENRPAHYSKPAVHENFDIQQP